MKYLICLLIGWGLSGHAQQTPRMAVEQFFTAFHKRDTVALRAMILKGAPLHSIIERKDGPKLSQETMDDLVISVGSMPAEMKFEEVLLSIEERIDGNMAHVWAPYEFYVDGKKSHSGVNSFQLFRQAGTWKILHLSDTRRR